MPLDTRIALGGQPLQVQYRDPIASYNQLAQLTSADTQNQLAQMQMQEHQQMAPYRMQEAQTKAASAKLTFDKAVEARDFIAQTMKAAEENSGGTAPKDPLGVIKAFLAHPNKEVQDVGTHMANAYQLIQDFEAEQRYITAKGGANKAPANVAAAAPAVPAPPMAVAAPVAPQEMFVTKDSSGRPRYVVNGVEVTPEEYQSMQSGVVANAISAAKPNRVEIPAIDNALAAAPAANVNALIAPVAKTAADIKAEIDSGDLQFGRSKRWANERALLVEQFKSLIKPPVMHVVDNKLVGPDGNVVYQGTPNMHFEKQVNADGTETILAINKQTNVGTPVMVNGVAVASVNPTIKAAQMRIDAEANKPAVKGSFEQLLDLANLDADARQKMILAKLAHDTAPPSAAADSHFEQTMSKLGLSDAQKNILRRQLLAKETRIPAEGGAAGKGRAPVGYRWDASGENLEIIPGGPADKQEKLKPIPANINTAISTNDMSIQQIQEALNLINKNPNAIGLKNVLPGQMLDRADPGGVAARSAIGNIGSLVIHERSGSAVSASEMQRLGFIPTPTDRADVAKTKLEAMLKWAKAQQQGLTETYGEDQGYKPNPVLSGKSKNASAPAAGASEWKVVK